MLLESHKHIVKLIAYDELKIDKYDFPLIVMKKYDGSLKCLVKKKRKEGMYPTKEGLERLFAFLKDSLKFIHKNGIIHRDIKPENILIDDDNFVLADFGIAYYNPEYFSFKAETKKNGKKDERLANYLFSAPEQSEQLQGDLERHPTMDIYALGQICQWYATGKTHKGTRRESITNHVKGTELLDNIIEHCLSNKPENRFQNIESIEAYIKRNRKKDPFNYLRSFSIVLAKTFPKIYRGITYIEDKKKIDMLLQNLSEVNFDGHLWWHNGEGNMSTQFKRLNDEVWLMGADKMFIEIKVKSAWVHSNPDIIYNECILINAERMPSFGVYGEESTGEEVGLVDDRHYITIEEFNNGFAEINGEIVDLKKHNVERRIREMSPMSYFIATCFHCVLQRENDETVRDLVKKIQPAHNISEDEFRQFLNEIRRNRHPDIDARL